MAEVTLPSKEMEEIHRRFKKGYSVEQARRGGHFKVLDPEGQPVRFNGRPLVMSGSPTDANAPKVAERELRKAGVLEEEPAKKTRSNGRTPQEGARRKETRAVIAARQRARAQEAQALHDQLATLLVTVGGFDQYGNLTDLADIGSYIARENGDPTLTPDLLSHSIRRVKNAAPIEERAQKVWEELIERLKNADKPSSEYFGLLRKARNIPEPDSLLPTQLQLPSGEWPFSVQLVPLEKLFIDHSYQRPQQWSFIRNGASVFDSTLVGAIDVSDRGGRFAIMDGQQRYEMMRLIGKGTCWAAVYVGLDTETESWFFIHKNKDRKNILPMHIFKAKITANDPEAVEISKIVSRNGYQLSLAAAGGENSEKNIASVAALETAFALDTLDVSLKMMHRTTLGLRQGNSAQIIGGIALLYSSFPELDQEALAKAISARSPEWLLAKSAELAKTGGGSTRAKQMRIVLMGEYNRQRGVVKLKLT